MLTVDRRRRVDWARIIENLQKVGMTQPEIAEAAGCSLGAVKGYRAGDMDTEPAFWLGVKLLKLWSDRTGIHWSDAPMRTVAPSVSQVLRESS